MALYVSGTELSGGGGGLHTLVNTYDAAGISADIDMDMDFSSYDKFRVLITDLYSSSASKIVFRCKNASNQLNYLNSGSYSAMGRKHAAGSGGTEVHAIQLLNLKKHINIIIMTLFVVMKIILFKLMVSI